MGLEDSKMIGTKDLRELPAKLRYCLENHASNLKHLRASPLLVFLSPLALPPAAENRAG
jgi:hypothetical protein